MALTAVVTLASQSLNACENADPSVGDKPGDFPKPAPHAKVWDNRPADGDGVPSQVQGPPVVNGDAGPQNDSHFVIYQLIFVSKRQSGGHVEYISYNNLTVPVDVSAKSKVKAGNGQGWGGSWETIERAKPSLAMGFTWFPIPNDSWAMCNMIYNGTPVDYQIVQGGPCAVSWTLPMELPKPKNPGK